MRGTRVDQTILIVDDSLYIVDGLAALLKRKGYGILTAYGGDEAIGILSQSVPDLILLDIMMEPMDGWETLDKIKANPATRDIPVLMFSAKKITAEEAQNHCLNIEDFVSKPVNPTQLMESIQQVFRRRSDVKLESVVAKNAGFDSKLVEEYSSLRKSIEVDKNLLVVLRNSSGMNFPGREVPQDEIDALRNLEEKIQRDEQRLKEINLTFSGEVPSSP